MIGDIWSLSVSRGSIEYEFPPLLFDSNFLLAVLLKKELGKPKNFIEIYKYLRFLNIDVCSKIMHFGSNSIILV